MRGVIVSVLKGEAGSFNNSLRREVYEELGIRSSKLPAHFTIKSPFEIKDLLKLDGVLTEFVQRHKVTHYEVEGYDAFDDRVIYMKVHLSDQAKQVHDDLIDVLDVLDEIQFSKGEGKDKVFHVTVSSKKIKSQFTELWNFVRLRPYVFEESFNNVSLFIWEENTWVLHKEYLLQS